MANDAQKRRILEHLKKSTDGVQYSPKKATQPQPVTPPPVVAPDPTPIPTPPPVQNRKQKIINHVKMSDQSFGTFSLDTPESRKKQIQEHLKKSLD